MRSRRNQNCISYWVSFFCHTIHVRIQFELYRISDYANGGELFSKLNRKFSKHQLQVYLAEIILAIENLHSLRIVHRDIKAENIMLDAGGHIVLIVSGEMVFHLFFGTIN